MKGFLLSMDAMVAVGILLMLVAFLSVMSIASQSPETQYQRDYYKGKDILNLMKNTKMNDVWNTDILIEYRSAGYIGEDNRNHSILDMVGHFWSSDNSTLAANLTDALIGRLLGNRTSFQVLMDDEVVYTKGQSTGSRLSKLDAIASGFSKGVVTSGYSTKA
ncbi:MAG: hypothetical protein ABIH90_01565, partial [Candidatus Aenigmatarchaeota archaeon]